MKKLFGGMHLTPVATIYSILPLWRSIRKLPRNFKIGLPRRTLVGTICSVCGGPKDFDALDAETTGPGGWDVCCFVVRNASSKLLSRQGRSFKILANPCGFGFRRCGT